MRLVQFELSNGERRVGVVEDSLVREVQDARTVRDLALAAIEAGVNLEQQVKNLGLGISHDYAELLTTLRILPPLDHPDPAHMLVSGTG
ncbi:MAG: AraD1 family protein, partial [Pseudomonas sp.]